jgi:hypothetical protein
MKTSKHWYIVAGIREGGKLKKYFWGVGGNKGLSTVFNNAKHYNTYLQAVDDSLYVNAFFNPEEVTIYARYQVSDNER